MKPPRFASANFEKILPFLAAADGHDGYIRLESSGYMPLSVENLGYTVLGNPVYSMAHYGEQNGDAMADPDMTLSVDFENRRVIPLTFQNDYMGTYQEVFSDDGRRYVPRLLADLDDFLRLWLKNIEQQGFDPVPAADNENAE